MRQFADIKSSLCDKPIVIDTWRPDETYDGMFPKGTRDKSTYFSPEHPDEKCVKGNYRYLFKLSRNRFPWQFWGEVIAYRLGLLIGIEVPPAHLGISNTYNQGQSTYGALIEWFYDDKKDVYVDGGQFMVQLVKDYDRQKGAKHNFMDIAQVFKGLPTFQEHWAGVFTLDSLIGNLDRHHDNWGLIIKNGKLAPNAKVDVSFSPAFDNGTALGYEILEENIDKYHDERLLEKYLTNPNKARHHMKWSLADTQPLSFHEFLKKFVIDFPATKSIITAYLHFNRTQIEEMMRPLVEILVESEYGLSPKRLDFMIELIFRRKELLERTLGL